MLIYALCRQKSRVTFMHFCRQIHQIARTGGTWGESSQPWLCQDFESIYKVHPSLSGWIGLYGNGSYLEVRSS